MADLKKANLSPKVAEPVIEDYFFVYNACQRAFETYATSANGPKLEAFMEFWARDAL